MNFFFCFIKVLVAVSERCAGQSGTHRLSCNAEPKRARPAHSHLCCGSEDAELQLWTDSSVEDFRGPSGDGSRLVLEGDGDSRLLLTDERNEPLRQPGRASALPASVKPASEGRTRIGGTVSSPVADRLALPQLAEAERVPWVLLDGPAAEPGSSSVSLRW